SYEPGDAVWFFSTGSHTAPANFAGRVGAFLAELSFQLFGYASYLGPALLVVLGWHYFWCRSVHARGTKVTGAALLFACLGAFLSLVSGTLEVSGKSFRAGGYVGEWLAKELSEYLNRTGSIIVIVTLIFLAIILATHFSLGRLFGYVIDIVADGASRALTSFHGWREERRREKQRQEVIAKHTRKGTLPADIKDASDLLPAERSANRLRQGYGGPPELHAKAEGSRYGETVARGLTENVARGSNETVARGFSRAEPDAAEPAHS